LPVAENFLCPNIFFAVGMIFFPELDFLLFHPRIPTKFPITIDTPFTEDKAVGEKDIKTDSTGIRKRFVFIIEKRALGCQANKC